MTALLLGAVRRAARRVFAGPSAAVGAMNGAGRGPSTGTGGTLAAGEFEVLAMVPIGPCTKSPSIVNFGAAGQQLPIKHAPVGPIVRQDGQLVIQPSPTR